MIHTAFVKDLPLKSETIEELHSIRCYNTVELLELSYAILNDLGISNNLIIDTIFIKYSNLY